MKVGELRYFSVAVTADTLEFAAYPDGKTATKSTNAEDQFKRL